MVSKSGRCGAWVTQTFYSRSGKQWLDQTLSLLALIVLSPLLLAAALAILLTSGRPVLFRQRRIGQQGAPFDILKFRTMKNRQESGAVLITAARDPRITRIGRLLRRTKIDELPQLVNVFVGEMSLVGPRPEVPKFVASYSEEQQRVLFAKPGITGPAAIAYVREEELLAGHPDPEAYYLHNVLPAKLALDCAYCADIRLTRDLKLCLDTVSSVFSPARSNRSLTQEKA